jgi:hypothetical protein
VAAGRQSSVAPASGRPTAELALKSPFASHLAEKPMSDPCAIIPTIFDPWEANMEPRRFLLPLELNPKRRAWLPHGSSYIRHLPH